MKETRQVVTLKFEFGDETKRKAQLESSNYQKTDARDKLNDILLDYSRTRLKLLIQTLLNKSTL